MLEPVLVKLRRELGVETYLLSFGLGIMKFNILEEKTERVVTTQALIITTSVHYDSSSGIRGNQQLEILGL